MERIRLTWPKAFTRENDDLVTKNCMRTTSIIYTVTSFIIVVF